MHYSFYSQVAGGLLSDEFLGKPGEDVTLDTSSKRKYASDPLVRMFLDKRHGNQGGFLRNDRIASLRPVEAIVCEGSGVQIDFARKLRTAGVPLHVFRKDGQAPVQPSQRSRRA